MRAEDVARIAVEIPGDLRFVALLIDCDNGKGAALNGERLIVCEGATGETDE